MAHTVWWIALVVSTLVLVLLYEVPKRSTKGITDVEKKAALENEVRKTLAQIFAGSAFLSSLYVGIQNLRFANEGQITGRFTAAITSLGEEKSTTA